MGEIIHLATGIICGGPKLWCGAQLETEFRESTGKVHALNATDKRERSTCSACNQRHDETAAKYGPGTKLGFNQGR